MLALFTHCATPVQPAPAAVSASSPARVEIVNLSTCAWEVIFTSPDRHEVSRQLISVGGTTTVTLPSGDYTITQTALSGLPAANGTRNFPLSLVSGESYRWPLATLLTAAPTP